MTNTSRRITALATLLAVAAAAIAVYLYTAPATGVWMALGDRAPALSADQLRAALLTQADHPAGTTFEEVPIYAGSFEASQGGMIVSPESCVGALKIALGPDAVVTGWMQVGSRPNAMIGKAPFWNAVGQVESGLDLNQLRAAVGTCKSGTVTWPASNLTAAIHLTEVPAPAVEGVRTFAYKSTMEFVDVTLDELKDPEFCPVGVGEEMGTMETVSQSCVGNENETASSETMDVTMEQYVGYAVAGGVYVESCAATLLEAGEMLAIPVERLQQAGII